MIRQEHALHKMAAVWLLPVVTLIVASSTGGNIALALRTHSETMALVTTTFSLVMVSQVFPPMSWLLELYFFLFIY
jgi:tellurite resistance protein TehA-like permease